MEETLKKLTEQIYNEGVVKANKEAEEIINDAKNKANVIINGANKRAKEIVEQAQVDSEDIRKKVNTELESTANQSITAIKQSIANVLINNAIDKPLKDVFNDKNFLKDMILTMFKNWDINKEQGDFNILFPEKLKLDEFIQSELQSSLKNKITFKPSKSVENGFIIEPKDSSYKISFTEEDFNNFIKDYIRPRTFELLYKK